MTKEFHFEEESVDMPVGIDPFKLRGRAFAITNKLGEELILHIGDEYWITDLESGRDGCPTLSFCNRPTVWTKTRGNGVRCCLFT